MKSLLKLSGILCFSAFLLFIFMFLKSPKSAFAASFCSAQDPFLVPDSSIQTVTFAYKYTSNTIPPTDQNGFTPPIPVTIQLFKNGSPQGGPETINLIYKGLILGEVVYNGIKTLTFGINDTGNYAYLFNNTSIPISGGCAWVVTNNGSSFGPSSYWTPGPASNCPAFFNFNPLGSPAPNDFDSNTDISLLFIPTSTASITDFKVGIVGGDGTLYPLVDSNSAFGHYWIADIGKIPGGQSHYDAQLIGNFIPDNLCGTARFFVAVASPSPTPGLAAGKNPCDSSGCQTAIGNIPINLGDFATAVLRIALGIAGGIVLILMVIGSIRVMTSSGDPQRVAAGRDMIVAALAGALFIAFSVMIMQFLGTAIVPIPGLTFGT